MNIVKFTLTEQEIGKRTGNENMKSRARGFRRIRKMNPPPSHYILSMKTD
jgi:hypothetical protein